MIVLKRWLGPGFGVVLAIAAAKLLLHLATASRYGYSASRTSTRWPSTASGSWWACC